VKDDVMPTCSESEPSRDRAKSQRPARPLYSTTSHRVSSETRLTKWKLNRVGKLLGYCPNVYADAAIPNRVESGLWLSQQPLKPAGTTTCAVSYSVRFSG